MRPGDAIGYLDPAPVCDQCNGTRWVPVGVWDDDGRELGTECPACLLRDRGYALDAGRGDAHDA